MNYQRPAGITLLQFSMTFVPFGLLLIWALVRPETTNDLELNRTKLTIWATTLLLIPALVLYPYGSLARGIFNIASLYWTAAYLTYMVHAYWATFTIFDGVVDTFRQQGPAIAGVNFFLTIVWTVDVLLLWWPRDEFRWLQPFRIGVRVFTFLVFAVTLLALRDGSVSALGIAFTAIILGSVALRFYAASASEIETRAGDSRP